jgi:micrococcal nuclease
MQRVGLRKSTRKKLIKLFMAAASFFILWLISSQKLPTNNFSEAIDSNSYKVISVEDGDTIKVDMNGKTETIRFIGVDTPETKDPRKEVQCFGKSASNFTSSMLKDSRVRLETDSLSTNRDRYNRLLRYVYKDNVLVNAEIVKEGYGFANTGFPFTKSEEFQLYEKQAKNDNKGLWGKCDVYELESGQKQTEQEN